MKKKVYILEDDPDLREILVYVLGKEYEIEKAEALDVSEIAAFGPDLILMDHGLGNSTSDQNIKSLKNTIPGFATPVILLSGHPDPGRIALDPLVAGYIQKPASIGDVREYLHDFFSRS
ncbi:MAG: response regulator [Chitinophagaceae bacterium]|nr:MAG: response regulator [Chitinophagaceae bacterium]